MSILRNVLAVALLVGCSGGESSAPAPTPAPAPSPTPAAAPAPAPAAPPSEKDTDISAMSPEEQQAFLMKLGEKVYKTGDGGLACITCHQENGKGMEGVYPPLVGQKEWMGDCKKHAGLVLNGLSGEIEVDGKKYNSVMVPQAAMLNDLQIAAVVSYTRQSWGNDYGFCMPADVAGARTP